MATNTVPTFTNHTGNGTAGPFNIGFNYIDKSEVIVRVNEVLKSTPTHYTFTSNTQITFTSGNEPASGLNIEFRRSTNITTAKVDFEDGSVLTEADLDANTNQLLFALQENTDAVNADNLESSSIYLRDGSRTLTGNIVFEGSTKDAHETTLTPIDPTADRTINIPNVSGTLVTTGDTGTVTSAMIADGTFVNADINANAAIAGTKVSPNFGSQNISTTGNVTATNFIGNGSQLTGITFTGIDQFLRRDIDDTASGNITFNKNIFIPNAAGSTNVFNDFDVLDTGNLIFGPTPDTTSSDPMQFNNYFYHNTANSNQEPNTILQLGTTSSSSSRFGSFTIKGNNETLVNFSKDRGVLIQSVLEIATGNSNGIKFANQSIYTSDRIPSLQIVSNHPDSSTPDSFVKCTRGNLNIICGVNGNGTVIKDDPGANGTNTIAVFKSDIGNNTGEAFHKGAVELYSEGTKRFETNHTGAKVSGTLEVVGTGNNPEILLSGGGPNTIRFTSTDAATDDSDDINLVYRSSPNTLGFERVSDAQIMFSVDADDQQALFAGNLDVGAGLDVTGNITVTGTVDGVDIATRDTLFGALTSSSGVLKNEVTATTQSAGNNTTRVATTAFVSTAIANLIDSSPSTLNTLNELASALGDDPNFATTVTNSIATKLPLAGGTLTGNLSVTGDLTLSDVSPSINFTDSNDNPDFSIFANTGELKFKDDTNEIVRMKINADGHVDVVGNLDVGAGIDVTGNITVNDTGKLQLGDSQDLQISHDGTDSFIENTAGNLHIRPKASEEGIKLTPDGSVLLYFNDSPKFEPLILYI